MIPNLERFMRKMKAVYISHPFGGKAIYLTLASRWVAWAARQEGIAPMAPWIILGQHFSEEEGRARGLEIDCRHVELCDELWICGPKVCGDKTVSPAYSPYIYKDLSLGMVIEVEHALSKHVKVLDMRQYLELVT